MSVVPTIERRDRAWHDDAARSVVGCEPMGAAAPMLLAVVPVVALGFVEGGFFPTSWAWAALGLTVAAAAALALQRETLIARRALVLLAALASLGLWIAASFAWTRSTGLSVLELQRLFLYVAGVGAAAAIVRRHAVRPLVTGVFLGTATLACWGLVSYLVTRERTPDVLQGSYLHRPLGYANAMAIVCVIAIVLGLAIAADSTPRRVRIATSAVLVPLASALALTGSRAAIGTLVVGVAVLAALEPNRPRLLATWRWIAVVPALAALAVSGLEPTNSSVVGAVANDLGNRLLVLVALLTMLAVIPAVLATRRERQRPGPLHRPLRAALWIVVLATTVGVGIARFPGLAGDRPLFWRVAIEEFREHPALGAGAGTYPQVWLERRPVDTTVRDAHGIVVETLAELGLVGAALVLLLLVLPLVWARSGRTQPLVPAAAGAFAAYAAHAAVDWDWEMPAVTLAALFLAVATSVAVLPGRVVRLSVGARRGAVALSALAAIIALVGLVGARSLDDARRSLARGDAAAAASDAARAARWQPWSGEPLLVGGRALLALDDRRGAQALLLRAAAREPNDYRMWLALAAASQGDAAETAVLRARALDPRAVRVVPDTVRYRPRQTESTRGEEAP